MEVVTVHSFDEFVSAIADVKKYHLGKAEKSLSPVSDLLFRGHADSEWKITTTLERYTDKQTTIHQYFSYLHRIRHAIQSYTGEQWDIEEPTFELLCEMNDKRNLYSPLGYPLMIYARHHGFPSPLLDWTLSPHIALYFAFSTKFVNDPEYAAVYCFIERPEGIKGGRVGSPEIIGLGNQVTTHERHFIQQAMYTICVERPEDHPDWTYSSHHNYFSKSSDDQDYIRKICIPRSLRHDVLARLDEMNINEYSLFRNEEGLMSMLAFREIMNR